MNILEGITEQEEQRDYWNQMLGEELLNQLLEEKENYTAFLEEEIPLDMERIYQFLEQDVKDVEGLKKEWVFYPFFNRIRYYILLEIEKIFQQNDFVQIGEDISSKLAEQYVEGIQWIALRCLMQEMGALKQEGALEGENIEQEYEFFLNAYLSSNEFLKDIMIRYPVMMGLILKKIDAYTSYLEQILRHLEQEKKLLEERLCNGRKINTITKMQAGLSDEHKLGKTVVRMVFDNGYTLYYKPRSLQSEQEYQKIYHWVCDVCGLDNYDRGILEWGKYGWEGEAVSKPCNSKAEIRRYYERIGIHLCLSYLFGVSDIHYENIIASGEYPVLIDMEVFPGGRKYIGEGDSTLEERMQDSVLSTGMLPGQQWGSGSVDISAMGREERQMSPFKMPVIEEKQTSHMHISYDYVEIDSSECMPRIKGQKVEAAQFISSVEKGFQRAYEYIQCHKEEMTGRVKGAEEWKSRCVIRNSQQYRMYQMTASFPEFMADSQARRLMLLRMKKGLMCEERYEKEILTYEAEATMYEVIPVYYAMGHSLQMGNGKVIENYFADAPKEQIICRLNGMSQKDMYRQQKIIGLSMSGDYPKGIKLEIEKKEKHITPEQVAERIMLDMEKIQGENQWIIQEYNENGVWRFQTMGRYLYDGVAGIAVFLMAFAKTKGMDSYKELRENVIQGMFQYTDTVIKDSTRLDSKNTGIMNGESSIVYAYLLLNQICPHKKLLEYAEKHAEIVRNLIEEDSWYDILDGNAGAVMAMVHLYKITGKDIYLKTAEHAADCLLAHGVQMKKGIGWVIPGQEQPLAGFAHGNSGIMLAFARLWDVSKKPCYYQVVQQAKEYEDSLFQEKTGNWKDVRGGNKIENPEITAWCHGAGGILAAGTAVDCILGIEPGEDKRLQLAEKKVITAQKDECCLCHGQSGNALVVEYYRKAAKRELPEPLKLPDWEAMLPQEKYQAGFMTGVSGMGYALLKNINQKLPNVLTLEI